MVMRFLLLLQLVHFAKYLFGGRCLVAQHLLLGINAHINLDLGVAAAAAAWWNAST